MRAAMTLWFLAGLILSAPATAQMTNAETISTLGGRIIGAAKACGVDGERLRKAGEKVFAVVNARSNSEREKGSATSLFASAYNVGIDQVGSGKVKCSEARAAFADIESKFAKY